jgi:hypothetical protein
LLKRGEERKGGEEADEHTHRDIDIQEQEARTGSMNFNPQDGAQQVCGMF